MELILPSVGASGGILAAWRKDVWQAAQHNISSSCISVRLLPLAGDPVHEFWLTTVYGLSDLALKESFLQELEGLATLCLGAWLICGDFNLIYQAQDKNNDRLNRRMMSRFRRSIDVLSIEELHLHGRRFTWSNERARPTLERIE
jgi:hypothetical protein